ncbi:transposase IS116/IS110/IS902 family protein [Orientia tsutsugamushi str. Kato PP]|nr:transposase IS116/IS110/IS902 family protein [Orientia tsutsugamushi str. Kato PP]
MRGASRISRTGNSDLRKSFYMPAMSALRHNCIIKQFSQRLSDTGKPKMLILIAAMRKLLHIIYGVLKHNSPFNPNEFYSIINDNFIRNSSQSFNISR